MVARTTLTRRGVLRGVLGGGLGLLALSAAACGGREKPEGTEKVFYGRDHENQFGVLARPSGAPKGLVVLLHGGFWSSGYGLDLMDPLAADLQQRGWATWNVEYRRIGGGGGYPATFLDVAAAMDRIAELGIDGPVTAVGHSAGGHLAAWAALRTADTPGGAPAARPDLTIAQSGVLCLAAASTEGLGGGAATALMGFTFDGRPSDYDRADPIRLLPTLQRIVAVHAEDDVIVPISQSQDFVAADRAHGGRARLERVPGDHFAHLDPGSAAWKATLGLLPR